MDALQLIAHTLKTIVKLTFDNPLVNAFISMPFDQHSINTSHKILLTNHALIKVLMTINHCSKGGYEGTVLECIFLIANLLLVGILVKSDGPVRF